MSTRGNPDERLLIGARITLLALLVAEKPAAHNLMVVVIVLDVVKVLSKLVAECPILPLVASNEQVYGLSS